MSVTNPRPRIDLPPMPAKGIPTMWDALIMSHGAFSAYAGMHRAKGTPDGDAKAQRNDDYAQAIERALAADLERRQAEDEARPIPEPAKLESWPLWWVAFAAFLLGTAAGMWAAG
jgi:hypothetical protein